MKVKGKRVETGIYRIRPNTYRVVTTIQSGGRKAIQTVSGDLFAAREAREALRKKLVSATDSGSLKSSILSIKDALEYYVEQKYKRSSRYILGKGEPIIDELKEQFGELKIALLDNKKVDVFVFKKQNTVTRYGNPYKNSGINPFVVTLKAALTFCVEAGEIERNPIKDYKLLEVVKPKKRIVPDNIREGIKKAFPDWAIPMVTYKELVPCRYLELCNVKIEDVSSDYEKLTIRKDKNGGERELPIPAVLVPYFRKMRTTGSPWAFAQPVWNDSVLTWKQFGLSTIAKLFKKVREDNDWDPAIKFRMLRHTTISKWMRQFDINLVSEVAGASPDTLREYYDLIPFENKLNAANKFARQCKTIPFRSCSTDTPLILGEKKAV